MRTDKKALTAFRVDPDLFGAMRRLQVRDGISFSEQMRRALRVWLEGKGVLPPTTRRPKRRKEDW
jgi:hypothetical protein